MKTVRAFLVAGALLSGGFSFAEDLPYCRILAGEIDLTVDVPEGPSIAQPLTSGTLIKMQNYEGGFVVDVQPQRLNFQLHENSVGSIRFTDEKSGRPVTIMCSTEASS